MHLNSAKAICSARPLIPLSLSFNATNRNKLSANREKSASNNKKDKPEDKPSFNGEKLAANNKKGKSKDKPSINREELANDNSKNPDNQPSANIKSLVGKKNIDQNGNAGV